LVGDFYLTSSFILIFLGHFFEMSRPDAERAMEIYKNFTKQTDFVVGFLNTARQYEHQTRVEVPKLKHAPVNLGKQLEDYLMDPDFEINRRQYLAEQESKKGRGTNGANKLLAPKSEAEARTAAGREFPEPQPSASKPIPPTKGPAPDLIDFFDSIEQNQQPMATQPGLQQQGPSQFNAGVPFQSPPLQHNGLAAQQLPYQSPNPFQQPQPFNSGFNMPQNSQQIQSTFTGAGFGGYTPQPSFQPGALSSIPQDSTASFQQQPHPLGNMQSGTPQATNPFRQSMMVNQTGTVGSLFSPAMNQPQSTNPFAKPTPPQVGQPFSPPPDHQFQQPQYPQSAPLPQVGFQPQQSEQQAAQMRSMGTGTNPFANRLSMNPAQRPQTSSGLAPQPTGSTNPFRQSQFVNTATGQGWQHNQQPIGGGLDSLEAVPVFPRPAQQQPWQQ
jgi:phosphatidylinositol-binding clathrin assembly protein